MCNFLQLPPVLWDAILTRCSTPELWQLGMSSQLGHTLRHKVHRHLRARYPSLPPRPASRSWLERLFVCATRHGRFAERTPWHAYTPSMVANVQTQLNVNTCNLSRFQMLWAHLAMFVRARRAHKFMCLEKSSQEHPQNPVNVQGEEDRVIWYLHPPSFVTITTNKMSPTPLQK